MPRPIRPIRPIGPIVPSRTAKPLRVFHEHEARSLPRPLRLSHRLHRVGHDLSRDPHRGGDDAAGAAHRHPLLGRGPRHARDPRCERRAHSAPPHDARQHRDRRHAADRRRQSRSRMGGAIRTERIRSAARRRRPLLGDDAGSVSQGWGAHLASQGDRNGHRIQRRGAARDTARCRARIRRALSGRSARHPVRRPGVAGRLCARPSHTGQRLAADVCRGAVAGWGNPARCRRPRHRRRIALSSQRALRLRARLPHRLRLDHRLQRVHLCAVEAAGDDDVALRLRQSRRCRPPRMARDARAADEDLDHGHDRDPRRACGRADEGIISARARTSDPSSCCRRRNRTR